MTSSSFQHRLSFLLWNFSSAILLKELCILYIKVRSKMMFWIIEIGCCWIYVRLKKVNPVLCLGPRLDLKQIQSLIYCRFIYQPFDILYLLRILGLTNIWIRSCVRVCMYEPLPQWLKALKEGVRKSGKY